MTNPDVVIVGGGIAGSALATVLSRAGVKVTLLEKTLVHKDVVRGEWLAPWGVAEANRLELTPVYEQNGAHRVERHITYSEFMTHAEAEEGAITVTELSPDRPLCLGHPKTCDVLNAEAVRHGTEFLRGVTDLEVEAGTPPRIRFTQGNSNFELTPRLVVGADGRNGIVANQIGCREAHDPEHHLFSGMLVENAHDWPADLQVVATEGDVNVLAFPQGDGRVRVYLGWPSEDRARLVGPDGPKRFLDSWRLDCIPHSDAISSAKPASPCIAYPNYDAWIDSPLRPGIVLIGDAAGRNDPIIGQGLSISHRDVRLVSDALLSNDDWDTNIFEEYVTERTERMSRLRTVARLTSLRESAFGPEGRKLREEIHKRIAENEELFAPFLAPFIGPEALPGEVFAPEFTTAITGRDIWAD